MKYIIILLIMLSACTQMTGQSVEINGNEVQVEVANTPDQRRLGLMYRDNLEENTGMLFVYPDEQQLRVWMKNTYIPLDIIFISKNGTVVDTATLEPCETEQCPIFTAKGEGKYFLEVNKGYLAEYNVSVGDKVNLKI